MADKKKDQNEKEKGKHQDPESAATKLEPKTGLDFNKLMVRKNDKPEKKRLREGFL